MIETERLILRNWRDGDVAPYYAMFQDLRVMAFLGKPQTLEAVRAEVTEAREEINAKCYGFWAVECRADRQFIGFCGVQSGPLGTPIAKRPEIGWRLAHAYWGQGLALEAAQATLAWAWAMLPDDSVWAITVPANTRSWGLMERLGMTRQTELDFDHPDVPFGSPLKRQITYRIDRPV
ncbi:MAG: GNAT family N-acetyltransferase [Sphingomonadaceae bacterium]